MKGEPGVEAMQLFLQMMRLPWATFAWLTRSTAWAVQGMQRAVDSSIESMLADLARNGAETTVSKDKESPMSCDNCGTDDCKVRLVQFSIVTIKRGEERILEYSQKLVTDPMTPEDFDTWVVADYVSKHPVPQSDYKYLRVWSQTLDSWDKQSLHYEEKQLGILQQISNKIGPPVQ